jgi:hypothetical protein
MSDDFVPSWLRLIVASVRSYLSLLAVSVLNPLAGPVIASRDAESSGARHEFAIFASYAVAQWAFVTADSTVGNLFVHELQRALAERELASSRLILIVFTLASANAFLMLLFIHAFVGALGYLHLEFDLAPDIQRRLLSYALSIVVLLGILVVLGIGKLDSYLAHHLAANTHDKVSEWIERIGFVIFLLLWGWFTFQMSLCLSLTRNEDLNFSAAIWPSLLVGGAVWAAAVLSAKFAFWIHGPLEPGIYIRTTQCEGTLGQIHVTIRARATNTDIHTHELHLRLEGEYRRGEEWRSAGTALATALSTGDMKIADEKVELPPGRSLELLWESDVTCPNYDFECAKMFVDADECKLK